MRALRKAAGNRERREISQCACTHVPKKASRDLGGHGDHGGHTVCDNGVKIAYPHTTEA